MLVSDFDYDLPPDLIAQRPAVPRDHSRLMHLRRTDGSVTHHRFDALPGLLRPDDLLVFNNTRVLRARLRGHKMNGDSRGARIEALLLREVETNVWEAMLRPSARLRPGTSLLFLSRDGTLRVAAKPVERTASGWIVRFAENSGGDLRQVLSQLGEVPLPPYITASLNDDTQYQTIFARPYQNSASSKARTDSAVTTESDSLESAAAPTAGLHFTPRLLEALQACGIRTAFVTLRIGIATFRPLKSATLEEHAMHEEEYEVPAATARAVDEQKQRGGRVVAVGTTSCRVLEAAAIDGGIQVGTGRTSIFIRPGYRFRTVDALLTNFHLPRSTLLVMIAAFAQNAMPDAMANGGGVETALPGLQKIRYAYSEAIRQQYRFFSFGDAMLID